MDDEQRNGDVARYELKADRRRVAGGIIWSDLVEANVADGQDAVDMLLDLMPELADRDQQITVKRVIKKLNGIVQRDSRLLNFREQGGD